MPPLRALVARRVIVACAVAVLYVLVAHGNIEAGNLTRGDARDVPAGTPLGHQVTLPPTTTTNGARP